MLDAELETADELLVGVSETRCDCGKSQDSAKELLAVLRRLAPAIDGINNFVKHEIARFQDEQKASREGVCRNGRRRGRSTDKPLGHEVRGRGSTVESFYHSDSETGLIVRRSKRLQARNVRS